MKINYAAYIPAPFPYGRRIPYFTGSGALPPPGKVEIAYRSTGILAPAPCDLLHECLSYSQPICIWSAYRLHNI